MQSNRRIWIGALLAAAIGYWVFLRDSGPAWTVRNHPPRGTKLVALGDSLTFGFGSSSGHTYPELLGKQLNTTVINLGRNGDTSADVLTRLPQVLEARPDIVTIVLGSNDLMQRIPLEKTLQNLEKIFTTLTSAQIMVVYGGISPPLVGDNWLMAIQQLCKEQGVLYAGDVMKGLWRDQTKMSDNVHPNDAGYAMIAERFYQVLKGYY